MRIRDVDCDFCKNNGKDCDDCIHSYENYPDHYEEIPQEEKQQHQEQELKAFKESLIGEKIIMPLLATLREDFLLAFALAHNFTSREECHPEYWCVYCGRDFLMATDTHAFAKIRAIVPETLVGKHLLNYDQEGVFTAKNPSNIFTDGQAQRFLDEARADIGARVHSLTKQQMDAFVIEYKLEPLEPLEPWEGFVQFKDGPVIQEVFLDRALAAIGDDEVFTIRYHPGEKCKPVLIESKNIECVTLPVRVD